MKALKMNKKSNLTEGKLTSKKKSSTLKNNLSTIPLVENKLISRKNKRALSLSWNIYDNLPLLGILIYLYFVFFSGTTLYYFLSFRMDIGLSLVIFFPLLYLYGRPDMSIGGQLFIALIMFILINIISQINYDFLKKFFSIKFVYFLSLVLLLKSIIFWVLTKHQIQLKDSLRKLCYLWIPICVSLLMYGLFSITSINMFSMTMSSSGYRFEGYYFYLLYIVLGINSFIYFLIPHKELITRPKILFFCFMLILYFSLTFYYSRTLASLFNPILLIPLVVSYINTYSTTIPNKEIISASIINLLLLTSSLFIFVILYQQVYF